MGRRGGVVGPKSVSARLAGHLIGGVAVLFLVANVIPQAEYFGRGAWLTFFLFGVWVGLAALEGRLLETLARQATLFTLAGLFLVVLTVTYYWRTDAPAATYLSIVRLVQLVMVVAVAAHHSRLDRSRWLSMREAVIGLIACALAPSLTLLSQNPRIARTLMDAGMDLAAAGISSSAVLAGLGTYTIYTLLGVVWPVWMCITFLSAGMRRLLLLAASAVAFAAVLLSSFTAASVLLVIGAAAVLLRAPWMADPRRRWRNLLVAFVILGAAIVGVQWLTSQSEAAEFARAKSLRLYTGVVETGFTAGDETGRTEMFVSTFYTFVRNPLFGVGERADPTVVGGHSSIIDPWAQYGLVGYWSLFVFQVLLTHRVLRNWRRTPRHWLAFGSGVSWLLYWVAGILNPTVFYVLPALLMFSDWQSEAPAGAPGTAGSVRPAPRRLQLVRSMRGGGGARVAGTAADGVSPRRRRRLMR